MIGAPVAARSGFAGVLRRVAPLGVLALVLGGCQSLHLSAETETLETSGGPAAYVDTNEPAVLGKRHLERGDYGLAEQHFRRAVELNPTDLDSWIGLAAAYDNLKRFDLADRAYMQALKLGARRAYVLNNRGYSHLLRGDFVVARSMFMQSLAIEPNNPVVLNNLRLLDSAEAKFGRAR